MMSMTKTIRPGMIRISAALLMIISLTGCELAFSTSTKTDIAQTTVSGSQEGADSTPSISEENDQPYSHSSETSPDYEVVFPQDAVNRIDITISPENWEGIMDNMTSLLGEFGAGESQGQGGRDNPGNGGNPRQPGGGGGDGAVKQVTEDPAYFPVEVTFNDETWQNVGFRFKGNSSLSRSWKNGIMKLSIKLDFDEFEDQYPEIGNQRFYGFKQLSLGSNAFDESLLHEKVAADVFREAGIAAPHTAFYEVYVDYGEGPTYFGLYTMVEVVDDTVIQTQFEDDSGNLYKPEGKGAAFVEGTFNKESFEKQTNASEADWSDIETLFEVLNADNRLSDPAAWRADLESVFDVDTFLHWLAVNTVMQNWDTYGTIAHNYYLYHDPTSDTLVWIPWDNNEALTSSRNGFRNSVTMDMSAVGGEWPLISYLIADETYFEIYRDFVEDTVTNVFTLEKMEETFNYYHELITPYVKLEQRGYTHLKNLTGFNNSVQTLTQHVKERIQLAQEFLTQY